MRELIDAGPPEGFSFDCTTSSKTKFTEVEQAMLELGWNDWVTWLLEVRGAAVLQSTPLAIS